MVYDYYGFPDETYRIRYGAPGSPELARRVQTLLAANDLAARLDPNRGFDHGTFSLMKPLYPEAEMPIVQLSLDAGLDPALHLAAGRALAPLRDERVLIVGSAMSYHNLRVRAGMAAFAASRQFDDWLQRTIVQAPAARAAHPREDHLLPLMAVVGAAWDDPGQVTFHQNDFFGGITVSSFRLGVPPTATGAVKAPHATQLEQ
jgi:aromatic ring-opening dioxygenase catalytic subunit (LigB family)